MSPGRLEALLEDLANVKPADDESMERWLRVYGSAIPENYFDATEQVEQEHDRQLALTVEMADVISPVERTPSEIREAALIHLHGLASQLRAVWNQPSADLKEWYMDQLRMWVYKRCEPLKANQVPAPPPLDTGLQQALRYFRNHGERARYCQCPECPRPYFFIDHPLDKYCSRPECRQWAIRRNKKKWAQKRPKKRGRRAA